MRVRKGISSAATAFAERLSRACHLSALVCPTDDEWRGREAMDAAERRTRAPFTLARLRTSGTASADAAAANRGPEPPALPPLPPALNAARDFRLRRGAETDVESEVAEDAEATGSCAIPNEWGQSDARTASPAKRKVRIFSIYYEENITRKYLYRNLREM